MKVPIGTNSAQASTSAVTPPSGCTASQKGRYPSTLTTWRQSGRSRGRPFRRGAAPRMEKSSLKRKKRCKWIKFNYREEKAMNYKEDNVTLPPTFSLSNRCIFWSSRTTHFFSHPCFTEPQLRKERTWISAMWSLLSGSLQVKQKRSHGDTKLTHEKWSDKETIG